MTPQEAINIIEDVSWKDNGRHYGKIVPARELAISALEKQIPKKPIVYNYLTVTICHCPNCNEIIGINDKRCYDCGQALDFNSNGSDTE